MPDYSKYTLEELYDSLHHIDKRKYSERTEIISMEIAKKKMKIEEKSNINDNRKYEKKSENVYTVSNTFQDIRIFISGIMLIILLTFSILKPINWMIHFCLILIVFHLILSIIHFKYKVLKIELSENQIIFYRKKTEIKFNIADITQISTLGLWIDFKSKDENVKVIFSISNFNDLVNKLLYKNSNIEISAVIKFRMKYYYKRAC